MVADLIRDAPFGQVVRFITKNRVFLYPEEKADFKCPHDYDRDQAPVNEKVLEAQLDGPTPNASDSHEGSDADHEASDPRDTDSSPRRTSSTAEINGLNAVRSTSSHASRVQTHPQTPDRLEEGNSAMLDRTQSRPIAPTRTPDGRILADWYDTEDPANPQNWSQLKKAWTATIICLYTFVVYASSSIYISSVELVMQRFGVGYFKAELGLALYVLGYGIGPLIFSPLSEVPAFGRNAPYITTFALFTILSLPTALVDNLGGLLVLRFLLGFFGSPCLASGGASMGDMYSLLYLPYAVAAWVSFAFAAPGLGPLLSGFAVYAKNWRWSQWEVLWMAGPLFLVFFFFVPETQPMTILHYRAARLRRVTGNEKIRTQVEMDRAGITLGSTVKEAIIKPIEITIKDPAILFVNVYTALMYGIYYSFFEVFPLVFPVYYGMNVGETGIVFVCIVVGCIIAMCIYFAYIQFLIIPDILKNGLRAQEFRLIPALFFCFGPTIGLFLFAWTARPSIHWIVCVIGITIYALSAYIIMQCIFTYIPMSYPRYAASLFAGNDFFRSLFAFGAVLFSRPMFVYLGVGKGCSLLGGLSVTGIVGMYLLYWYGARLRARSRFAVSG